MIKSNETFSITNLKGGTAISAAPGSNTTNVTAKGNGLTWTAFINAWGMWSLQNNTNSSQKYLAVLNPPGNGTQVVISDKVFLWDICPDYWKNGSYRIGLPNSPYVLDLSNFGDPSEGNPITLWQDTGAPQQRWKFEAVSCNNCTFIGNNTIIR